MGSGEGSDGVGQRGHCGLQFTKRHLHEGRKEAIQPAEVHRLRARRVDTPSPWLCVCSADKKGPHTWF